MNNTLESHRIFPIIAWILVIGFAIFTYALSVHVRSDISGLSDGVERLEAKIDRMGEEQTNS